MLLRVRTTVPARLALVATIALASSVAVRSSTPSPRARPLVEGAMSAPRRVVAGELAPAPTLSTSCAGYEIEAGRAGIVAFDADRVRWTWLWRGNRLGVERLVCVDGVVVVWTQEAPASVVAIDPSTGGWLFEPGTSSGEGALVWFTVEGPRFWERNDGSVIPMSALHAWLATPAVARGPLAELALPPAVARDWTRWSHD